MANRIDPSDKRKKSMGPDGIPYIYCNKCNRAVKWGWLNPDVMALPERVTKEDWFSRSEIFCKQCK